MPKRRLMSDDYQRIEIITGTERRRRWSAGRVPGDGVVAPTSAEVLC